MIRLIHYNLFYGLLCFNIFQSSAQCTPEIINEDIVTLGNQTFSCGAIINTDKLVFKNGCRLRIPDGKTLIINAHELHIESKYYIDAQGENSNIRGSNGIYWIAHNGNCNARPYDSQGHEDFEKQKALGDGANRGGKGGAGGTGGTVVIKYCIITGIYGAGISDIVVNCKGGNGGPGGQGNTLDCPCHPTEKITWSSGSQGDNGLTGSYKYQQRHGCY